MLIQFFFLTCFLSTFVEELFGVAGDLVFNLFSPTGSGYPCARGSLRLDPQKPSPPPTVTSQCPGWEPPTPCSRVCWIRDLWKAAGSSPSLLLSWWFTSSCCSMGGSTLLRPTLPCYSQVLGATLFCPLSGPSEPVRVLGNKPLPVHPGHSQLAGITFLAEQSC